MNLSFLSVLFAVLALALAANESENETFANAPSKTEIALLTKLNAKCSRKHETSCMMLKLVAYMNRLMKKSSIQVADSVEIVETISEKRPEEAEPDFDESARSLEAADEETLIGQVASQKLSNFVKSRSLVWNVLPGVDVVVDSELNLGLNFPDAQTGRGKNKNMGPLIAAGVMKLGMLKALAFKALALLVGKALLLSKLAFILTAIIGLKKLLSQPKHVTYEVVSHPHHAEHGHDSYSAGWGRSLDAQNLAYNAQKPETSS
ncbi:hypothetical protein M8J75_007655 [Diaphorina citri]|nr:hypothetical protein M8J75_007655 [Diaphorina citri]